MRTLRDGLVLNAGGEPVGRLGQAGAAEGRDLEDLAAGASRLMSAVIRSMKLLCGNRSVLVMNRACEPWKMAGYLTALSSPFADAEDDDPQVLAQVETGRADQVAHVLDRQQIDSPKSNRRRPRRSCWRRGGRRRRY